MLGAIETNDAAESAQTPASVDSGTRGGIHGSGIADTATTRQVARSDPVFAAPSQMAFMPQVFRPYADQRNK
jgi:hypothetical protein